MIDRRLLMTVLGTTALTTLGYWLLDYPARANPQGATVVGGNALVVQTSPSRVDIDQSSNNAVINWQSFSVGAGEQTNFNQPSATSLAVNRVVGVDPSTIAGRLTANGQVVLTNPNGVLISQGARIDAAGFIATTSGITNANAMAGNLAFTQGSSSPTASVVNRGRITVKQGGLAALVAPGVENDGVIQARLGKVALASGQTFTLDLNGDRLVNFAVGGEVLNQVTAPDGTPLSAAVVNAGKVSANGGIVEISVDAAKGVVDQAINMTGIIQADTVRQVAGAIVLDGGAGGVVNLAGTVDATGSAAGDSGGRIKVAGSLVMQTGTLDASGAVQGGTVRITADKVVNQGRIAADGASGDGGAVAIRAASVYIDTESSTLSAQSLGAGNGGRISVTGGASGSLFVSGTHSVRSAAGMGGSIGLSAGTVQLVAATLDASGATGGGTIDVGGDLHGQGTLLDATTTLLTPGTTLDADARNSGNGGAVVVWSDTTTTFAGAISARGGAQSGDGGAVEVSSKGDLVYDGTTDVTAAAGTVGTLLLDPANIVIDDTTGGVAQYQLIDPDPTANGTFGEQILTLANGNIVVTNPADGLAGTDAGAVYLFNGKTAQLISALTGDQANDEVGSNGVTVLSNGNFAVLSPNWSNGAAASAGAVSWGSATAGVAGMVSAANSLVGTHAYDYIGNYGLTPIGDGNYVVESSGWNTGAGAVTWINVATPTVGAVSASNSLVGGNPGDNVDNYGVTVLSSGNYVVVSPNWGSGGTYSEGLGAVTWGDAATGISGVVSAANSLVGSNPGDQVGSSDVLQLSNGNYVVSSPSWGSGGTYGQGLGAVTWGSGTIGVAGVVSAANSLVGSTEGDQVGSGGITQVGASNYVVISPDWTNPDGFFPGAAAQAGAVTWGSGTAGVTGVISAAAGTGLAASLVGDFTGDNIGSGGVTVLTNANYVVDSPNYQGLPDAVGAVTWGSGATGVSGDIFTSSSSLVGFNPGDAVGSGGVTALSNGNFVVLSPSWSGNRGAATWGNGTTGFTGQPQVSASNSLIGATPGDQVGSGGVQQVGSGNYVVLSPDYQAFGTFTNAGAVTWGNGTSGVSGTISAVNSLVGSDPGDDVGGGGIAQVGNGNYVVLSPSWGSGGTFGLGLGAATWGNGDSGVSGAVSAANSLVGSNPGDEVGDDGVVTLSNGNYVVVSPVWGSGGSYSLGLGAVTWGNGATGIAGTVSAANSLVGGNPGDLVGYDGVIALSNGDYVVNSSEWGSGGNFGPSLGAVTWGSGATGVAGTVSAANSLVGSNPGDQVGGGGITTLANGDYVVVSNSWGSGGTYGMGLGAATWGNAATGVAGIVSATNSLVGSDPGDQVGSDGVATLGNGDYVVLSSNWGSGGTYGLGLGAATWGNAATGITGIVSAANSLVGSNPGDSVGNGGVADLGNGSYVVLSPSWNGGAGAVSLGSTSTGLTGAIDADNSLLGQGANADLTFEYYDPLNQVVVATAGFQHGCQDDCSLVAGPVSDATAGGGGQVQLGLFDPNLLTFDRAQDQTVTLSGTSLAQSLLTADVTLQANNDITFDNGLSVAAGGNSLTLEAGRSIVIDANSAVVLDGGFTAVANDSDPAVIASERQAGAGQIAMAAGSSIDTSAGDGAITLQVDSGGTPGSIQVGSLAAGTGVVTISGGTAFTELSGSTIAAGPLSIAASGSVTLAAINASTVLATSGTGGDITLNGVIAASGGGDALVLASGGNFINTVGAGALVTTGAGRWLVYSQDPALDQIDGLVATFEQYDAVFGVTTVAQSTGDGLLYAIAPVVTLTGITKTYDGTTTAALVAGGYTETGGINGDSVALAGSVSFATRNAGGGIAVSDTDLTVSATNGATTVYGYQAQVATPDTIGTIDPEALTITAAPNTKTYDGTTSAAALPVVTAGTLFDLAALTETYATRNAGTGLTLTPAATIADGNGGNNYAVTLVASTAGVINPEALTVTAAPNTKTYDGTTNAAALPVVTAGTLFDPAALTETYATRNAGTGLTLTPAATIADGNGGDNYVVTLVTSVAGVINPEALTVTAAPNTKTYDSTTNAAALPVVTAGTLFDPATLSESYTTVNVGSGLTLDPTAVIADGNGGNNYAVTLVASTAGVIDPATLTLVVTNASRTYGTINPTLGGSVSGLQGSDTLAELGLSFATTAIGATPLIGPSGVPPGVVNPGSPVGAYPITATIVDANYVLSPTPGTLTVTPATLAVAVNSASRTYGAANPVFTGSILSGLLGTDSAGSVGLGFATTAQGGTPAAAGASVGSYPITASISSPNYTISSTPGTLVINPALLTVVVSNAERPVGEPNPTLSAALAGLRGSDTAATVGLAVSTTAIGGANGAGGSPSGSYLITATVASPNYVENLIPGTLTIAPAGTAPATTPSLSLAQLIALLGLSPQSPRGTASPVPPSTLDLILSTPITRLTTAEREELAVIVNQSLTGLGRFSQPLYGQGWQAIFVNDLLRLTNRTSTITGSGVYQYLDAYFSAPWQGSPQPSASP